MSPENQWLEDVFLLKESLFEGTFVGFRVVFVFFLPKEKTHTHPNLDVLLEV